MYSTLFKFTVIRLISSLYNIEILYYKSIMSPTRLTEVGELNFVIEEGNTNHFRTLMQSNRIPYRVAIFKAIESGSSVLFNIVKNFHPNPTVDVEMECLHAAFRGHLNIYGDIWYDEEVEEFNPYIENMYLLHGRFDKIDLVELNIRDLISPNTIPVSVCDLIVQHSPNNSCLMTGVLLAYCIHNSDHYTRLENNDNVYIMEIMLQYATQHANHNLKLFLLNQLKRTRKYTTYQYTNRKRCMQKERKYVTNNCDLSMYDDYLMKTPDDINCGKSLNAKGNTVFNIPSNHLRLTTDLFAYPADTCTDMDAYVDQVLSLVNRLIDEGNINL